MMNTFLILGVIIVLAVGLNYLLSLILMRLVKQRASFTERVVLSSVDDADSIHVTQALDDEKKKRLWADAMNIIMRAEKKSTALKYSEKAARALGETGVEFMKVANQIIQKRFGASDEASEIECSPEVMDVSQGTPS